MIESKEVDYIFCCGKKVIRGFLLRHVGKQLSLYDSDLSVNHSEDVQLTAASEGKVLRCVREYISVRGWLNKISSLLQGVRK